VRCAGRRQSQGTEPAAALDQAVPRMTKVIQLQIPEELTFVYCTGSRALPADLYTARTRT